MLKKLVMVAVVGALTVAAFKGTKWASYVRQELRSIKEAAEDQIPPEKEVARLRGELQLLENDMMKVVNQLAKERVDCERLKEQVAELQTKQSNVKEILTARANTIKDAEGKVKAGESVTFVLFGERKVGLSAARTELADGVSRYTTNQKSLETLELTLSAREQIKDGLEKQLEELKNQKMVLANEVDALEAELNRLKLEQMKSKYSTDNTRLTKIKEDMRALKMKVDVEREKLKLMPAAFDGPTNSPAAGKSVDDIMAPVNSPKQSPAKPAPQLPACTD